MPQEEEEPSEGQLAALHKRAFVLKGASYCDFAIWTLFSRKNLKLQKFRLYVPLGGGSYLMKDFQAKLSTMEHILACVSHSSHNAGHSIIVSTTTVREDH